MSDKTHVFLLKLFQSTYGKYLVWKHKINVYRNDINQLSGPFVLLSNHVNNWDPFLLSIFVKEPIIFVTSTGILKNRVLKSLLNLVQIVPKDKFKTDMDTIRKINKHIRNNKIVGIFPEGKRSWDGVTTGILYPTAKLIKVLKVPVVISLIKGGAFTKPRWAKTIRKGKIELQYKHVLTKEMIERSSVEEIYSTIKSELRYNEQKFVINNQIEFRGKALAENLEKFLFICPNCLSINTLRSKDNIFSCTNCNYEVEVDPYGNFSNGTVMVHNACTDISNWNHWQLNILYDLINNNQPLDLRDSKVVLYCETDTRPLYKIATGELILDGGKLQFLSSNNSIITFSPNNLIGINVQSNNKIDFYHGDKYYRLLFLSLTSSPYMWVELLKILQEKAKENK